MSYITVQCGIALYCVVEYSDGAGVQWCGLLAVIIITSCGPVSGFLGLCSQTEINFLRVETAIIL